MPPAAAAALCSLAVAMWLKVRLASAAVYLTAQRASLPARPLQPLLRGAAMPPKFFQADVLAALRRGEAEEAIRADLQARGCPKPRISQMFKGARDIMKADADANVDFFPRL